MSSAQQLTELWLHCATAPAYHYSSPVQQLASCSHQYLCVGLRLLASCVQTAPASCTHSWSAYSAHQLAPPTSSSGCYGVNHCTSGPAQLAARESATVSPTNLLCPPPRLAAQRLITVSLAPLSHTNPAVPVIQLRPTNPTPAHHAHAHGATAMSPHSSSCTPTIVPNSGWLQA